MERLPRPLTAAMLRQELAGRARRLAAEQKLLHDLTPGGSPSVIFGMDESGRHGNFQPASYASITARQDWAARMAKVHTAYRRCRARADWAWKELDCASSSDALLMNIFCYPGVLEDAGTRTLLGVGRGAVPEFGFRPGVPLRSGKFDRTEIDMRLGSLLVEAKLTESGFQQARPALVERYRDLDEVFAVEELPRAGAKMTGYQLIRGVLAARANGASFCVLSDGRRGDLIDSWYSVLRAVRSSELKTRLQMLTWQELAGVLPAGLQEFLLVKYGILAV